tara:strand:+ start:196 stop:591 length:396 start_codon:yes stop_codon:yes gene_type:complete
MKIVIICGEFHKDEANKMIDYAIDEAKIRKCEIVNIVKIPGSMEAPLALDRALKKDSIDGAVVLGIIEKGETKHGQVIGQAVTNSIIDLQIKHNKPIGLGIIGPGAKAEHIDSRLESHARSAVNAVHTMKE